METDVYSFAKAGLGKEEIDEISQCKDRERQVRLLRKCRYRLLDEIHGKQQALDGIDYMISKIQTDARKIGKTVIPFCTHDGYGAGGSYQTIAEASHAASALEGIAIEAKDVPNAQDTVFDWLASIGISEADESSETETIKYRNSLQRLRGSDRAVSAGRKFGARRCR